MSIFNMADLSHLGFYGSNSWYFEKPMYDFLYSSIALNCLVFEKIAFLRDRQTDIQTIFKQMDSNDALSRSRYRERRLNKKYGR